MFLVHCKFTVRSKEIQRKILNLFTSLFEGSKKEEIIKIGNYLCCNMVLNILKEGLLFTVKSQFPDNRKRNNKNTVSL